MLRSVVAIQPSPILFKGLLLLTSLFCFPYVCESTAKLGLGCRDLQCPKDEEGMVSGDCYCLGGSMMRKYGEGNVSFTHMYAYPTPEENLVYNCGVFAVPANLGDSLNTEAFNEICDHTGYSLVTDPVTGVLGPPSSRWLPNIPAFPNTTELRCSCKVKDATAVNRILSTYEEMGFNWTGAKTTNLKCKIPPADYFPAGRHLVGYMVEVNGYRRGVVSAVPYVYGENHDTPGQSCVVHPMMRGWPLENGEVFEQTFLISRSLRALPHPRWALLSAALLALLSWHF